MTEKVKNLIVGCGLSGMTAAAELAARGERVLIVDRREHIGGNIYDFRDGQTGITVHRYGPHVFHTNDEKVWNYLSRFTGWHYFMYRVKALIDGREVNIPFNLDSLHRVFGRKTAETLEEKLVCRFGFNRRVPIGELKNADDADLRFLGQYVYEKVFAGYTAKQWGMSLAELDASVGERVPVYTGRDDRYFHDKYQAVPDRGYTAMSARMLDNPLIEVRLATDFRDVRGKISYERLFYSGAVDEYFDYEFGRLPYRSAEIVFVTRDCEYAQSGPQINYPENYDFTRSVEYKYYLDERSDKTVVSYEYPQAFAEGKNERFYPVPRAENEALYRRYADCAAALQNVYFFGRLGDYRYYNMDEAVRRALDLIEGVK